MGERRLEGRLGQILVAMMGQEMLPGWEGKY